MVQRVDLVEVIEVVHVVSLRGQGVASDPVRQIDQYWSKDGKLLAECDRLNYVGKGAQLQEEQVLSRWQASRKPTTPDATEQ